MNSSLNAKVEQAIWDILQVYKEESYVTWANNWLNGTDRSGEAAFTAYIRAMAYADADADADAAAADAAYTAYLAFASAIAAKAAAYVKNTNDYPGLVRNYFIKYE